MTSGNLPASGSCVAQDDQRAAYTSAFKPFAAKLSPSQRRAANGALHPDWQGSRTFALPINAENPHYRSGDPDQVLETLEELAGIQGGLVKIALFLNDRMGGVDLTRALEQFRISIDRICAAKIPRLEAEMIGLAIGMDLKGNANGFEIAQHYGLSPQAFHENLSETCLALGLPKPLSKVKTDRYRKTQYCHNLRKKSVPS